MIAIIDYGMGNLRSVSKALEHLGLTNATTSDPDEITSADRVILPGVGAFGDAMAELDRTGLVEPIRQVYQSGKPLLGICLGMQLFMEHSEEAPNVMGLGFVKGTSRRFKPNDLKVPHMGWNTVNPRRRSPLLSDLPESPWFYFVHSYYVDPAPEAEEAIAGTTDYGITFASTLWKDNLMATQFHPEKSQAVGLKLLETFSKA